jgi:uncharacterized protein with GYD domain
MTTYIALFNLTEAGIKAAKDSPRRLDAAKKLLADMGGEMKQFYLVMGEFDFVGICEAPDDAVMARYVLQLGGLSSFGASDGRPKRPPQRSDRGKCAGGKGGVYVRPKRLTPALPAQL